MHSKEAHLTLGEYVFQLVTNGKVESSEFKTLLVYYGRDKLAQLYLEEKKKQRNRSGVQCVAKTAFQKAIHDL